MQSLAVVQKQTEAGRSAGMALHLGMKKNGGTVLQSMVVLTTPKCHLAGSRERKPSLHGGKAWWKIPLEGRHWLWWWWHGGTLFHHPAPPRCVQVVPLTS